jgi:hypothetical protein
MIFILAKEEATRAQLAGFVSPPAEFGRAKIAVRAPQHKKRQLRNNLIVWVVTVVVVLAWFKLRGSR